MTLRDNCTTEQLRAHAILDEVRRGIAHGAFAVVWALRVLGEPVAAV